MAFKRREGLIGGNITKYIDHAAQCCPFCGSKEPAWLSDAYVANYSLISTECVNGYKFQCSHCGGVLEIQGKTDFCFNTENFESIKLLESGTGTLNKDLIGKPLTIQELKNLTSYEHAPAAAQPAPQVEEPKPVEQPTPQVEEPKPAPAVQPQPKPVQQTYSSNYGNTAPQATNSFEIAALICAFLAPTIGLILAIIGLNKAKELGGVGEKNCKIALGVSIAFLAISVISGIIYGVIYGLTLGSLFDDMYASYYSIRF